MLTDEERNLRYEIKMECDPALLPSVHSWIRLHFAAFNSPYPPRQVNSIYFDTPDLATYDDHVAGVMARRKLRFRWYGTNLEIAKGNLELKEKNSRIGWKLTEPVQTTLDLKANDWRKIRQCLLDGIKDGKNKIFQEMLLVSSPIVLTSYQREYFVSANQQVRLTIDYNITSYNQLMSNRPNLKFQVPTLNMTLIELKADIKYARYLSEVLARFPTRVNRHSKFISAINPFLEN